MKNKNALVFVITILVLGGLGYEYYKHLPPATAAPAGATSVSASDSSIGVSDLVFKDLDGKELKLSDLKGKVVLLDFWATWCEPCKIETPWLIEFQKKYGP